MATYTEEQVGSLVGRIACPGRRSVTEPNARALADVPLVDYYERVMPVLVEVISASPGIDPHAAPPVREIFTRIEGIADCPIFRSKYPDAVCDPLFYQVLSTIKCTDDEIRALRAPLRFLRCTFSFYLRLIVLNPYVIPDADNRVIFFTEDDLKCDLSIITDETSERFGVRKIYNICSKHGDLSRSIIYME